MAGCMTTTPSNTPSVTKQATMVDVRATECFTQFNSFERSQLMAFTATHDVDPGNTHTNGAAGVCVLTQGPKGQTEQFYNSPNTFSDYYMYSLMLGNTHGLANYSLITGHLNYSQNLTLKLLTDVNSTGLEYHPYRFTTRGWAWKPIAVPNEHVSYVRYGNSAAVSLQESQEAFPPSGYPLAPVLPQTIFGPNSH